MYRKSIVSRRLSAALLVAFAAGMSLSARAPEPSVTAASHASFDQTVNQLKSAVGQGGMMAMATVNQGNMLSMTGLKPKATLFLAGNPNVGKMIFEQNPAVGLYVPVRVYAYRAKDGTTYVGYDKSWDQASVHRIPHGPVQTIFIGKRARLATGN